MPASASSYLPERLIARLSADDTETKLKALRDLKNQIIGNRTKKQAYLKHGAVSRVVDAVSSCGTICDEDATKSILIQSIAVLGSFSCGVDYGARAVLDAGAFPHLWRLISHANNKVVNASARALRMLYQSRLAPKYDFSGAKPMELLNSLLDSDNENLVGLGLSAVAYSSSLTSIERNTLCDGGILEKLHGLLIRCASQRDACLESLSLLFRGSVPRPLSERAFRTLLDLTKDARYPRTQLLACACLIDAKNASPLYSPNSTAVKRKLVSTLLQLLEDDRSEAPFVLRRLISEVEGVRRLAFEAAAVDTLVRLLRLSETRCPDGLLLALAELCASLECCRSRFLSLQALSLIARHLGDGRPQVRVAALACLCCVARSVKNLSAGVFMNETVVVPLVRLLHDDSAAPVQVAALRATANIVVDFTPRKSVFMRCGGLKNLSRLCKSPDPMLRLNAARALRNLTFSADATLKEAVLLELTASALSDLVFDPELPVQEQALALVRNLVDAVEDGVLLRAVARRMAHSVSEPDICVQGMYALNNMATGSELHREAVMQQVIGQHLARPSFLLGFLRSSDARLRLAAVWTVLNLTSASASRFDRLRDAGVFSQLLHMLDDPCLEVQLRVKTALAPWKLLYSQSVTV